MANTESEKRWNNFHIPCYLTQIFLNPDYMVGIEVKAPLL